MEPPPLSPPPPPLSPPPPPALMDEFVEECLLRLPPDDPANLIRAALVCKRWRRIVTHRGFRRRFCKLHRSPPMLGFFHEHKKYGSCFTPTSSFRPRTADLRRLAGWHAIDSRHGRVLLSTSPSLQGTLHTPKRSDLAVWSPITGDRMELPEQPPQQHPGWLGFTSKAAVLCAASGSACDHLDCHRGHFLIVLVDAIYLVVDVVVDVYVYSSQAGAWRSHIISGAQDHGITGLPPRQPVTMAGNALYFIVHKRTTNGILKYDIGAHEVSLVDLPPDCSSRYNCHIVLMTTEHGGLGIVRVEKNSRLHLWSREAAPNSVLEWTPSGVIKLKKVLPANCGSISTVAFVHGLGAFFVMTKNAGAFTVDLVSKRVRKVRGNSRVKDFVPYASFCTPALGAAFTGEGPTAGVPTA